MAIAEQPLILVVNLPTFQVLRTKLQILLSIS
jgi:hypothetical protein